MICCSEQSDYRITIAFGDTVVFRYVIDGENEWTQADKVVFEVKSQEGTSLHRAVFGIESGGGEYFANIGVTSADSEAHLPVGTHFYGCRIYRNAVLDEDGFQLEKAVPGKTISSVWFGVDAPLTTEQWSALTGVIIQGYGQLVQAGLLPPNLFSTVETPLDIVIPEVPEEFSTEGEKEFHVRPVVRLEATLGFTRDWVNQPQPPEAEELAAQLRNKINGTV